MLKSQRKVLLLQRLTVDGQIVAKDVARELSVSEDTIRRDLRELAHKGKLQRVHGGALPSSTAVGDMQIRTKLRPEDKQQLGRIGAAMLQPGQVVMIDGGTTTLELVRAMAKDIQLTVVTHSPTIASALIYHPLVSVIMLGGTLFKHSMVNVGTVTLTAARRIRADLFFLGATGIHPSVGLTAGDFEEAQIKRVLHEQSDETICMASNEKIGAVSHFEIMPVASISQIIVIPSGLNPIQQAMLEIVREQGVSIHHGH
jgi:DeoR/GlpR family transcriptional regulator of sugar metabolism